MKRAHDDTVSDMSSKHSKKRVQNGQQQPMKDDFILPSLGIFVSNLFQASAQPDETISRVAIDKYFDKKVITMEDGGTFKGQKPQLVHCLQLKKEYPDILRLSDATIALPAGGFSTTGVPQPENNLAGQVGFITNLSALDIQGNPTEIEVLGVWDIKFDKKKGHRVVDDIDAVATFKSRTTPGLTPPPTAAEQALNAFVGTGFFEVAAQFDDQLQAIAYKYWISPDIVATFGGLTFNFKTFQAVIHQFRADLVNRRILSQKFTTFALDVQGKNGIVGARTLVSGIAEDPGLEGTTALVEFWSVVHVDWNEDLKQRQITRWSLVKQDLEK